MTLIIYMLSLLGVDTVVLIWLVAMLCDTAILITAMVTGIIH